MIRGFDISENNVPSGCDHMPESFWQAAVDAGCKFVFVRCSWGSGHEDSQFRRNVSKAHEYGLKVGAYHYDYSLDADVAGYHAAKCRQIIADAGVLLELPVMYDLEDADKWKERNGYDFKGETATDQCRAWLENIGLNSGVYASQSWLQECVSDSYGFSGDHQPIDWESLGCPVWNAEWGKQDDVAGFVWQDTDRLDIGGVLVDGDWMYDSSIFKDE